MKSLSRVRLFVTPWTVAYQVPPSMGFSRQEYWSGVPFPFLLKSAVKVLVTPSCLTHCDPMDCSLPGSSVHGIFQAIVLEWIAISFSKTFESESHSVVTDSLQPHGLYGPWNFPGQNTGVGSHSLLPGIFPAQGSNPGLPHGRQILYQLSHLSWWTVIS